MLRIWDIFWTALKLGMSSFGGPTAHLAYFQQMYVKQKNWLSEKQYADLVALSQFLPGPASSQVGMGIGLFRGGFIGSIVAFIGFTLPSVLMLIFFATWMTKTDVSLDWLQGLKLVAVAIIAQAIWDMSKKIIQSKAHAVLLLSCIGMMFLLQTAFSQLVLLLATAVVGTFLWKNSTTSQSTIINVSKKLSISCLVLFFGLLISLPILSNATNNEWLVYLEKFYYAGAFVFGGGHVVLPLLETQFVQTGLMTADQFLVGYGITQAVPGPLFTFASYLGYVLGGIPMAIWATFAIFLPAFLLIVGVYPFWVKIGQYPALRGAVSGMNVAVIALLISAFINPIISSTIHHWSDFLWASLLLIATLFFKVKPIGIVLLGLGIGIIFY